MDPVTAPWQETPAWASRKFEYAIIDRSCMWITSAWPQASKWRLLSHENTVRFLREEDIVVRTSASPPPIYDQYKFKRLLTYPFGGCPNSPWADGPMVLYENRPDQQQGLLVRPVGPPPILRFVVESCCLTPHWQGVMLHAVTEDGDHIWQGFYKEPVDAKHALESIHHRCVDREMCTLSSPPKVVSPFSFSRHKGPSPHGGIQEYMHPSDLLSGKIEDYHPEWLAKDYMPLPSEAAVNCKPSAGKARTISPSNVINVP